MIYIDDRSLSSGSQNYWRFSRAFVSHLSDASLYISVTGIYSTIKPDVVEVLKRQSHEL